MSAIDTLLSELHERHVGTGRERVLVVRVVGDSVRVTVSSSVQFDELIEADGLSAEDAAQQLLSPSQFSAKE
jgi:hypothetical protein